MEYISVKWLVLLACVVSWTTFFSFFNTPGIRGYRNLGILGSYILAPVMFVSLGWKSALATWVLVGGVSGIFYFTYEAFSYLKAKDKSEATRPKLVTIFNGLFWWPIMLPEAIEYLLAELGILKAAPMPQGVEDPSSTSESQPTEG